MCAIFGSSNLDNFYKLYELNKQRGSFSIGCLAAYGLHQDTSVFHNYSIIKDNDIHKGLESLKQFSDKQPTYFVGHIQAPTGVDRFTEASIHPFIHNKWVVAHNGVLTNFEDLKQKYNFTDHSSNVDSSIIPRLLDYHSKQSDIEAIKETFSELDGTFSTWIYNTYTYTFFLCRLSSTLFYKDDEFSSVQVGDMVEVPEKKIFMLLQSTNKAINKFIPMSGFNANSHFFTLE